MNNTVYTKTFDAPPVDRAEILRYAGVKHSDNKTDALLTDCLEEIKDKLFYKVCYAHFPLNICDKHTDLSFMQINSSLLRKTLSSCDSFVLFAATVGIEPDRLIARYGKVSPSRALMLQAIGAERIESLCDEFNNLITNEAQKKEKSTSIRISPGYGDFPLDAQKDFFRVLEPYKKIGISLNESLLISPSKSVTAIIGISSDEKKTPQKNKCSFCNKADCTFRR